MAAAARAAAPDSAFLQILDVHCPQIPPLDACHQRMPGAVKDMSTLTEQACPCTGDKYQNHTSRGQLHFLPDADLILSNSKRF